MACGISNKSVGRIDGEQSCENAAILTLKTKNTTTVCGLEPFFGVPGRGVPAGPVSLAATAGLKGHPRGPESASQKTRYCLGLTWFSRITGTVRNPTGG